MKISLNIVVPDYLVAMIIGKNGDIVKSFMKQSECSISFYREVIFKIIGRMSRN